MYNFYNTFNGHIKPSYNIIGPKHTPMNPCHITAHTWIPMSHFKRSYQRGSRPLFPSQGPNLQKTARWRNTCLRKLINAHVFAEPQHVQKTNGKQYFEALSRKRLFCPVSRVLVTYTYIVCSCFVLILLWHIFLSICLFAPCFDWCCTRLLYTGCSRFL